MTKMSARTTVWRFEYRTDLTRAGSPIIPLAYMVEADWKAGGRWLGMLLRLQLTANELAVADLETWPELGATEPFLKSAFEEAWSAPPGQSGVSLQGKYSPRSALQLLPQKSAVELIALTDQGACAHTFGGLTEHIWTFKQWLQPALKAEVLDLKGKRKRPPLPEPKVAEVSESVPQAA